LELTDRVKPDPTVQARQQLLGDGLRRVPINHWSHDGWRDLGNGGDPDEPFQAQVVDPRVTRSAR